MPETRENSEDMAENPLVIYLNRIQRQLIIVTDLLYNTKSFDSNNLQRRILGLIDNLPPVAENAFRDIIYTFEKPKYYGSFIELSQYYRRIHQWIYIKLLQETKFGLTMTATLQGTKETPKAQPLNPNQTSRI